MKTTVSTIDSTLEVIKENELTLVKCSSCNKGLVSLHLNKAYNEVVYKLVVDCPFCGDASFATDIYGPLRFIPEQGVRVTNLRDETKSGFKVTRFTTARA